MLSDFHVIDVIQWPDEYCVLMWLVCLLFLHAGTSVAQHHGYFHVYGIVYPTAGWCVQFSSYFQDCGHRNSYTCKGLSTSMSQDL